MGIYYSSQEYSQMEKSLNKIIKSKDKEIEKLRKQNEQLKEDYKVLLETATEHVTE